MLEIEELSVMQNGLRYFDIQEMVQYVASGGFWTVEALSEHAKTHQLKRIPSPIEIAQFEDGREMIHDGHHRIVATLLGGRHYLKSHEYIIKKWKYSNYQSINLPVKWVTPLNPRTEVRLADIHDFKTTALKYDNEKDAVEYILNNKQLYCRPRLFTSVIELIDSYNWELIDEKYTARSSTSYCQGD